MINLKANRGVDFINPMVFMGWRGKAGILGKMGKVAMPSASPTGLAADSCFAIFPSTSWLGILGILIFLVDRERPVPTANDILY